MRLAISVAGVVQVLAGEALVQDLSPVLLPGVVLQVVDGRPFLGGRHFGVGGDVEGDQGHGQAGHPFYLYFFVVVTAAADHDTNSVTDHASLHGVVAGPSAHLGQKI